MRCHYAICFSLTIEPPPPELVFLGAACRLPPACCPPHTCPAAKPMLNTEGRAGIKWQANTATCHGWPGVSHALALMSAGFSCLAHTFSFLSRQQPLPFFLLPLPPWDTFRLLRRQSRLFLVFLFLLSVLTPLNWIRFFWALKLIFGLSRSHASSSATTMELPSPGIVIFFFTFPCFFCLDGHEVSEEASLPGITLGGIFLSFHFPLPFICQMSQWSFLPHHFLSVHCQMPGNIIRNVYRGREGFSVAGLLVGQPEATPPSHCLRHRRRLPARPPPLFSMPPFPTTFFTAAA